MSATEMAAFGIAQVPWAAAILGLIIANHKRETNREAWYAERTRVVAPPGPPKVPAARGAGTRDANGYVRDAGGRFAPRNGTQAAQEAGK